MSRMQILLTATVIAFNLTGSCFANFQDGIDAFNKEDYKTALFEWKPLAKEGDAVAQYNIGLIYENAYGVLKDYKEAAEWYRKSAKQGFEDSEFSLGYLYSTGDGVPRDYKKASKWYRRAAEKDLAIAQYHLGWLYTVGYGVPYDLSLAKHWFKKSYNNPNITDEVKKLVEEEWNKLELWKY